MKVNWLGGIIGPALGFLLAPMLLGMINRIKAFFAGRAGQPLLQPYFDLIKLFAKGAVYGTPTTWLFSAGPIVTMAVMTTAMFLLPMGSLPPLISFPGDLFVLFYLLALGRFFTVLAALDTGSSFEGMGAAREVTFAAIAELPLVAAFLVNAIITGSTSLYDIFQNLHTERWISSGHALILAAAAVFVVFLAENSRIPIDDPNTHLELTMIHEVMVLDHGGVDFGWVQYGAALKMWVTGNLLLNMVCPASASIFISVLSLLCGMVCLSVFTGIIESITARLRMFKVPQMLLGAFVLSVMAILIAGRQ